MAKPDQKKHGKSFKEYDALIEEFSSFPQENKENNVFSLGKYDELTKPDPLPEKLKNVKTENGQVVFIVICKLVRRLMQGLNFSLACNAVGESTQEITRLCEEYPEVSRALHWAYAENILDWINRLKLSGVRNWQAYTFYLEHHHKTYFGDEQKHSEAPPLVRNTKVSSKGKDVTTLSDEELLSRIAGK